MPPLHLLTGDDDLLLQRATERVLDQLTSDDPELSVEVYEAAEVEGLPELRTQSLFGGRVCVVVRGLEGTRGQGPPASLKAELEDYCAAPDEGAVLVLVTRGVGRIQRINKLVKQHGQVHEAKAPPDWRDDQWRGIVTDEFRRAGRTAEADAVAAILDHAGLSPSAIASKVAQAVASTQEPRITADHVEAVVEGHGRRSGFDLADAIADRDAGRAIALLRGSLEAGEAPLALLGAITYRFRQLQQARAGVDDRRVQRLKGVAFGNFAIGELAWCMDRLAQLDVDLKGNTDLPPDLVLEFGVIDLATPREVGVPWNPLTPAG